MSRAREFADLAGSADAGGITGRNLVINGAMQVAQRGTSSTSEGYHTIDRWRVGFSGGAGSLSQQELTLGQTDLPRQFRYFARLSVTTGADFAGTQHRIEGVDVVSDEKVTLSFYAKGTNPGGGSVRVSLRQIFGSGGSGAVDVTDQSITLTSSWQRFELTYDVPSLSGKTIGTSSYLQVKFGQGSDTSTDAWTIDFTGVQLEVGSATPFEHRSFADELARCQRYFQTLRGQDRYPVYVGHPEVVFGSANLLQTPMRAQPSLSVSGALSLDEYYVAGRTQSSAAIGRNSGNTQCVIPAFSNFSSMTRGNPGAIYNANIDIDAEL